MQILPLELKPRMNQQSNYQSLMGRIREAPAGQAHVPLAEGASWWRELPKCPVRDWSIAPSVGRAIIAVYLSRIRIQYNRGAARRSFRLWLFVYAVTERPPT